jgi:MFS family permease
MLDGGAPVFVVAMAGMILAGVAEGAVSVAEQTIIQRCTPDGVRSRVNAAGEAAAMGAFSLSFPAAGFVINLLGVRGAYAMAGFGCVLAAAVLVPAMRAARATVVTDERLVEDAVAA